MKKAALGFALALFLLARAGAWEQVTSPRVLVLYPRPELAAYARMVDRRAEAALDVLEPLFGSRPGRVVLRVNDRIDFFNAYATTVPRRSVELLAPVPAGGLIDLRSPSITYLLLVHELTHTRQLTYTEKPGGKKGLRLGMVTELSAPMPPAWFVEGIATYMESRFTGGGRLDWGYTQALINGLLTEEGAFPSLAEMSLYTYRDWPGGWTRYLLGVRFVDYLIEKHGWQAVLKTLQEYNNGFLLQPPFSSAWRAAAGTSLEDEWRAWKGSEMRRQTAYASVALPFSPLLEKGAQPAVSPDLEKLAYTKDGGIWVARADGTSPRQLAHVRPQRLWWADASTLLYSRYVREGDGAVSDVFKLDVTSGRETRLTHGGHARLAAPAANGCFYYVRSRVGEPDALASDCNGKSVLLWKAAAGERLLGLAVSPGGRVALAVWRGGNVDIALFEAGRLRYLTAGRLAVEPPAPAPDPCAGAGAKLGPCAARGRYQHLDPVWNGDYELLFRADEGGVFDLYRLDLPTARVSRLSVLPGGAEGYSAAADGYVVATLGPRGSRLVRLEAAQIPVRATRSAAQQGQDEPKTTKDTDQQQGPYSPWASLAPYGWLFYPAVYGSQPAFEVGVFGLDDSGQYSYRLSVGYAPLSTGPLGGAYTYLDAGWNAGVDLVGRTAPLGFTLRAGSWPGPFGIEAGLRLGLASSGYLDRWNWRAGAAAGPAWRNSGLALEWNGGLRFGLEERDPWGYLKNGLYAGLAAGGDPAGYALGYAGAAWEPLEHLGAEVRVFGGRGLAPGPGMVPAANSALAQARLRYSLKTAWRSSDGYLALERLTFAPGGRLWYDGGVGYGAELGVYADATLLYAAPLPLGLEVGYARGWWFKLGLGPW